MTLPRIISADSHTLEPSDLWIKTIGDKYGDETPRVVEEYRGHKGPFFFTGKQYTRFQEQQEKAAQSGTQDAGHDPAARVTFQQKTGIEAEVLYPTLGLSILHSSNRTDYRTSCARRLVFTTIGWLSSSHMTPSVSSAPR